MFDYRDLLDHAAARGCTPARDIAFRRQRINIVAGVCLNNKPSVLRIDESEPTPLALEAP